MQPCIQGSLLSSSHRLVLKTILSLLYPREGRCCDFPGWLRKDSPCQNASLHKSHPGGCRMPCAGWQESRVSGGGSTCLCSRFQLMYNISQYIVIAPRVHHKAEFRVKQLLLSVFQSLNQSVSVCLGCFCAW